MANKKTSSKRAQIEKRRAEQQRKQRNMYIGLAAVLVIIIIGVVWALSGNQAAPVAGVASGEALPMEVNTDQAYELVQNGAFLLDVREQYEWDDFHATNATLIPLGELASRVDEVPRDQEIVVICNSGNRSQEGRDILLAAGFESVTSAAGGVQAWRAAGYPIE